MKIENTWFLEQPSVYLIDYYKLTRYLIGLYIDHEKTKRFSWTQKALMTR